MAKRIIYTVLFIAYWPFATLFFRWLIIKYSYNLKDIWARSFAIAGLIVVLFFTVRELLKLAMPHFVKWIKTGKI